MSLTEPIEKLQRKLCEIEMLLISVFSTFLTKCIGVS